MTQIYTKTNENLISILRGINVEPTDYILAVGGSGDQAFALLEYAKRILVVDINKPQVEYIEKQAEYLKNEKYKDFLIARFGEFGSIWLYPEPDLDELLDCELHQGTKHFTKSRLREIRRKLPTFKIKEINVLDACRFEKGFNKIYLSNSLNGHPDELCLELKIISQSIPVDGLVYASNGETIHDALDGSGLVFDEFLTARTWDENWHPIVLRKVA